MYTYTWYQWMTFFYVYCFFGWIFESAYVSILQKRLVNRGFLRIPMLPIYGSGAVMMLWVSIPVQDSLFLTWLSGVIGATILEYVTGYVMELLFKVRYWDYSDQKFNLHGYICLSSSIAWGFLTILMTHVIHKPFERAVLSLPLMWNLLFVTVVSAVFVYDVIICTREALAFGKALEAMQKLRQEIDSLHVQNALMRMEAEARLQGAKAELREQLENRRGKLESVAGTSLENLKEKADSKIESLFDLKNVNLDDLKAKADGKLDGLRDLKGISLEGLRGKTEQQLSALLKEKEAARLAALQKRIPSGRKLFRSNPTALSKMYEYEFKAIKEYIEKNGGQSPL